MLIKAGSESDTRFNCKISIGENEISLIEYKQKPSGTVILDSHNDHRLAMSLALFSCQDHTIQISGIEVVDKSYPGFWNDIEQLNVELNFNM